METTEPLDIQTQLPEILERVARGERFLVLQESGKPVARSVDGPRTRSAAEVGRIVEAVERMEEFRRRRTLDGLSLVEIREMIEEGRR